MAGARKKPSANEKSQAPETTPDAADADVVDPEIDDEPSDDEPSDDEPSDDEVAAAASSDDEVVAAEVVLADDVDPTFDGEDEQEVDDGELGVIEAEVVRPITALVPSKGRSLAVRDPLQAYINEARRYPLLSREEEHELAVAYQERGDLEAAKRLVASNLRLVVKIAHQYRKAYRNLLDLVQEGNIGLMHAVKKFDPYRGVKLSSYAAWWIKAYILKFVLNNWRLVKIGTTQSQRKLFFNLRKEVDALKQMGIEEPGPKLLAERLDVTEQDVTSMQQRLSGRDVSLDAPLRSDDEGATTRLDFISDSGDSPHERVADKQFSELLHEKISAFGETLAGRDREIFELRTVAEEPLTLQQIGDRYGITRERARQIERRMMDRLRDHLRAELGDAVDIHLGTRD